MEATREEEWPAASDGAFGTATGVRKRFGYGEDGSARPLSGRETVIR